MSVLSYGAAEQRYYFRFVFDVVSAAQALGSQENAAVNRAVAVNVGAVREALSKVYHAHRIIDELTK